MERRRQIEPQTEPDAELVVPRGGEGDGDGGLGWGLGWFCVGGAQVGWGPHFTCSGQEVIAQEHVENNGNGRSRSGTNVRRSHQSRKVEN